LAFNPNGGGSIMANHFAPSITRHNGAGVILDRKSINTDHPTGIAHNPTTQFLVTVSTGVSRPAEFLIATSEGRLYGLQPDRATLVRFNRFDTLYTGMS
jgi:hypothetical protein